MIQKRLISWIRNITWQSFYTKIDFKVKYIWVKDFVNEIHCKKVFNIWYSIWNKTYLVMFRGTPCMFNPILNLKFLLWSWSLMNEYIYLLRISSECFQFVLFDIAQQHDIIICMLNPCVYRRAIFLNSNTGNLIQRPGKQQNHYE